LILYNEEPSLHRAVRERHFSPRKSPPSSVATNHRVVSQQRPLRRYAFGADAAAQLYFGKSADQLTPAESAILAAASETPALNPLDAPQVATNAAAKFST